MLWYYPLTNLRKLNFFEDVFDLSELPLEWTPGDPLPSRGKFPLLPSLGEP